MLGRRAADLQHGCIQKWHANPNSQILDDAVGREIWTRAAAL
jgi:hypothetical protein